MSTTTWYDQSITANYYDPNYGQILQSQTITADGTTYAGLGGLYDFSISYVNSNEEQLSISTFAYAGMFSPSGSFNGPVFVGPYSDTPLTSVLLAGTNMSGLTSSDVTDTPNTVAIDWAGLNFAPSTYITVDIFWGQTVINGPTYGGVIQGDGGNDLINAFGWYNTIYAGSGNDEIFAGKGNATIYAGTGSDTILLNGYTNIISGGTGNDTVTGSSGTNTITLGDGNDYINVGGYNNKITLGNGNDTISGSMGSSTVTLGSGNDVVNLTGYNNVINASGSTGNDTIMAGMGSETVTTGSGNDTITLAGYYNVVNTDGGMNFITGGSGDDTFALPTAGQGFDTITSFLPSYGDKLDVSAALTAAGWSTGLTLSNYLQVTESGSTATLSIVPGGSGSPVAIAQLDGFTNLTLASLQSHLIL